jgi:hypothetical protein
MILILNVATSAGLFVLILLTQVLIYPSLLKVPEPALKSYHAHHCQRISWVVGPLMLIDAIVALLMFFGGQTGSLLNGCFAFLPLLVTFVLFMPLHNKIAKTPTTSLLNTLIAQNLWRVMFWGAKLVYSFLLVGEFT